MSFIIKLVKTNKITISILIVASFLIYLLYRFIFWGYPNFIRNVFYNYACPTKEDDFSYNIGTFGDMYGGLNAFLSGLAFIGAVIAILLQLHQINQDKNKHKDEIIVQLNLFKWHLIKLKKLYLPNLVENLNWDGKGYNFKILFIDFKDDYSFKEILNMNLSDLYRGFIFIQNKNSANNLIEFFQQLRHIREDYITIDDFKAKQSKAIKDVEDQLKLSKDNLNEILTKKGKESLAYEIFNYGSNIITATEPFSAEDSKFLDSLSEYKRYIEALDTEIELHNGSYFDKVAKTEKIQELLKLIDPLIESIPNV